MSNAKISDFSLVLFCHNCCFLITFNETSVIPGAFLIIYIYNDYFGEEILIFFVSTFLKKF